MTMQVASLASGSSGNSYYIQCSGGAILVDAGISGRRVVENILAAGGDPARVKGIIITHDHGDHVSGAGALHRKHGWRLWLTPGTREAAAARLGRVRAETIVAGGGLRAAGFDIHFAPTPHDGAEPVTVSLEHNGRRCGVLTDLGHVFAGLAERLEELDFAFLESNYDPALLAANRNYPLPLKARIRGDGGHLSNHEAAELLAGLKTSRLRRVALSHLSRENNRPDLALACLTGAMAEKMRDMDLKIAVAPRHEAMRLCAVV